MSTKRKIQFYRLFFDYRAGHHFASFLIQKMAEARNDFALRNHQKLPIRQLFEHCKAAWGSSLRPSKLQTDFIAANCEALYHAQLKAAQVFTFVINHIWDRLFDKPKKRCGINHCYCKGVPTTTQTRQKAGLT